MTPFAVRSNSFALYQAFKTECEEMGYSEVTHNPFAYNPDIFLRFDDYWGKYKYVWSCLNPPQNLFSLPTDWDAAIAFAREQIKPVKLPERLEKYNDGKSTDANQDILVVVECHNKALGNEMSTELRHRYNAYPKMNSTLLLLKHHTMLEKLENIQAIINDALNAK